jgi:SAM-dependent methyltransferase
MTDDRRRQLHEENRRSWNEATKAHNSHKGDQAAFFRDGGSTLFPEEVGLLGDIAGKDLLHLQCNAGQDTLSLARLGARVTGVDISDEAIAHAQRLSAESGIPGTFVRADVYDWLDEAEPATFDRVFCSYGAVCWLSDLDAWARGIAKVLRPGGRFVVVDFHPFHGMFDEDWEIAFPYSSEGEAFTWDEGIGDYVAEAREALVPWGFEEGVEGFANPHPVHEFMWGTGEIVNALIGAGLVLDVLNEYPYANGYIGANTYREEPGRRLYPPEGIPNMPLMYGIAAHRPER